MLNILLMITLLIILFIIILLAAGIRIKFEYIKKGSELKGCLKILVFKKIKIYTMNFPSADEDDEEESDDKEEFNLKKIIDLAKPCFKDLLDYLKSILSIINITKIENHFIIGMESYADTGKYIGIIWGVLAIINPLNEKLKISAEPSFAGSALDGHGDNEFDLYLLKLISPTLKLLRNKNIINLIRGVIDEL